MRKLKLTRDKCDYERDEEGVGEEKSQCEGYLGVLEQSGFSFRSRRRWRRRNRFNAHGFSVFQSSASHFRFIIPLRSALTFSFSFLFLFLFLGFISWVSPFRFVPRTFFSETINIKISTLFFHFKVFFFNCAL